MNHATTNEMRYNPLVGEWVIYATARRTRPDEMRLPPGFRPPAASHEPRCPFCPGNEHMLPNVLLELADEAGAWKVRVVPNRYPALTPEGETTSRTHGVYRVMQGIGQHEVIIESRYHDRPIGSLSEADARSVIAAYRRRYRHLSTLPGIRAVYLFRNHGAKAGASLAHPHAQILATGLVPRSIMNRRRQAITHFRASGRCLLCQIVEEENHDGRRVLFDNGHFVGFVPFAAESPCEIWVVPKAHRSDFGSIPDSEMNSFAEGLQAAVSILRRSLNDPDYNFVIHSTFTARSRGAPALHWFVQIQPCLTTAAGFEMGSGIRINPSLPEADADFLRGSY